ncbi:hypothetical protein M758_N006300 [Ceratodon purpureus]|nr:hypothetical protein M758_N006300 [Ceratodon purpureus]
MAMAMEALRAASVAPVLHAHRHHTPQRHAAAALFRFQTGRVSTLSKYYSSSSSRCTAIRSTWGVRASASAGSGSGGEIRAGVDVEDVNSGLESCVEVAGDGSRFLHVMASSMHNVDNGSIIGLTCVPITKGHSSARNLEFPLFLNALAASPIRIAVEKGGLPHALEELGNLNDLDLEKIYVSSFGNVRKGGDFLVLDEKTGVRTMVASTFPQAIAVALRYRQPFLLKLETLLSANGDFIDRMLINPLARDQDGDVEWLSELSKSMHLIVGNQSRLKTALKSAVDTEQYEEALQLKQELVTYDTRMNQEAVHVLQRLRTLYLERMGIFFKL